MLPMQSNITKLYLSNFLTGFVFWYGIEKLFMQSIGLDAAAIGVIAAFGIGIVAFGDIPSGILADAWSRKGTLMLSAACLGGSSLILGLSHGFNQYICGYLFYSLYVVATSGTYQAIMYDTLHELGRSQHYSQVAGRSYALFLAGAGLGDIIGGFVGQHFGLVTPFLVSVLPCLLNIVVMASLVEPVFHKAEHKERLLKQLTGVVKQIAAEPLLRVLAIVLSLFWVIEMFKLDFGQLYLLRYVSSLPVMGSLWALYAFVWAGGSLLAHRFKRHLTWLIVAATVPIVLMAAVDHWVAIVFLFVQIFAMGALQNQIETKVQAATPAVVRASVLSVLSFMGRFITIPASIGMGWVFQHYGVMTAVSLTATVAVGILVFWFVSRPKLAALKPEVIVAVTTGTVE
jgi:MFS family permease